MESGKLLNTEDLVMQRNRMFSLQNELAIGIAHLRSISIRIIDAVERLRDVMKKEIHLTDSTISVFWKNQNYLLKMTQDVHFLFEVQPVRYWIGFVPNPLMIPPNSHNPREKWSQHSSKLFSHFFGLHREKQQRERKSNQRGRKTAIQQDRKFISDNLNLLSSMETSSISSFNASPSFSSLLNPGNKSKSIVGSQSKQLEDWEQLRDYCAYSWNKDHIVFSDWPKCNVVDGGSDEYCAGIGPSYIQHIVEGQFFWNNSDHNPYVVEAAVGFKEVFPSIYIVPPLPTNLLIKSLKLQYVLEQEQSSCRNVLSRKEMALHDRAQFLSKYQGRMEPISIFDTHSQENTNLKFQLKYRQQSDSYALFGINPSFVHESLQSIRNDGEGDEQDWLSGDDSPIHKLNNHIKPMQLSVEDENIPPSFITQESKSLFTEVDVGASTDFGLKNDMHSQILLDTSEFRSFLLETSQSKVKQSIEAKIDAQRKPTYKNQETRELHLIHQYSPNNKAKFSKKFSREFSRLDMKWIYQHARNIQRLIRGYLGRKRVRELRARKKWQRTIIKLQAVGRGFMMRLHSQRRLQQEKINAFIIRKKAVNAFRAAIIITQFIRKYVNLRKLMKNEPILYDKLNKRGEVVTRHQTLCKLKQAIDVHTRQALIVSDSPYKNILLRPEEPKFEASSPAKTINLDRRFSNGSLGPGEISSALAKSQTDQELRAEINLGVGLPEETVKNGSIEHGSEFNLESSLEENSLSQMALGEEEKRKFQKYQALSLIKRLNAEKFVPDSVRDSRLIPVQQIKKFDLKQKKFQLSRKEKAFLKLEETAPSSLVQDPNCLYISPLSKPEKLRVQNSEIDLFQRSLSKDDTSTSTNRLQGKYTVKRSPNFENSFTNHAEKLLSLKHDKELKEQEKFRGVLRKFIS